MEVVALVATSGFFERCGRGEGGHLCCLGGEGGSDRFVAVKAIETWVVAVVVGAEA